MPVGSTGDSDSFMSLRLLLLRSWDRRTNEEKELVEIVKKSFRGYSKDNKRTGAELATLVAKDWMYLSASLPTPMQYSPTLKPAAAVDQHKCHIMQLPPVQTKSNGTPTMIPSQLSPGLASVSSPEILPQSALSASGGPNGVNFTYHQHNHHSRNATAGMLHPKADKAAFPEMPLDEMHVVPET